MGKQRASAGSPNKNSSDDGNAVFRIASPYFANSTSMGKQRASVAPSSPDKNGSDEGKAVVRTAAPDFVNSTNMGKQRASVDPSSPNKNGSDDGNAVVRTAAPNFTNSSSMGRQRASVAPSLPDRTGSDDGNAVVWYREPCEEERLFEGELKEEEEFYDKEPNKEEKPSEEGRPCEEEPNEKQPTEEPNEEPIEEDPSEGSMIWSSTDCDDRNQHWSNSPRSSSEEKKRRSVDTLDDHVQKRLKQDTESESCVGKLFNGEISLKDREKSGSSGKRRHSKWNTEPGADGEAVDGGDMAKKKRKIRWTTDDTVLKMLGPLKLPDFVKGLVADTEFDPQIQMLNSQLFEINRKLKSREVIDDRPEDEWSPSSPPIYNNFGIRVNTREARLRVKLTDSRQQIISDLIQKNPIFKAPSDYKPPKFYNKLYIPVKEYPGYNFIGLIIGPRGHTQKRMEKETGARILLRGKGSSKLGKAQQYKDAKPDFSENEDLHVYIEADSQKSLDAAVGMVEKLLVPVEEEMNEHKRAQLRELAELNSSLREENLSKVLKTISKTNALCSVCGNASHLTSACPLKASTPDTGTLGGLSPFGGPPAPTPALAWMGNPASGALPLCNGKPIKDIDEAKLFVGFLPQSVNGDRLRELFRPFGSLCEAIVIKDKITGLGKGYGFVKYTDPAFAAKAVAWMNGYRIDGKILAVRVAGRPPSTANIVMNPGGLPSSIHLPTYPGPVAITQGNNGPIDWPGSRGSIMLPEPYASFPKSNGFLLHTNPLNGKSLACFRTPVSSSMISGGISSSRALVPYSGYLKSLNSQDYLYQLAPFSGLCPLQSFGSPQTPFIH